jgi:hypothetical protein
MAYTLAQSFLFDAQQSPEGCGKMTPTPGLI